MRHSSVHRAADVRHSAAHRAATAWERSCQRIVQASIAGLLCCVTLSCSRGDAPGGIERLAILPIENLTSDRGLDWISQAASAILVYNLTGPKNLHPIRAATQREARAGRATRYLEAYFANEHGALAFHVTIEDAEKLKAVRTLVVSGTATDIAGAMNRLAKELAGDARPFSSCNGTALRLYGEAIEGRGTLDAASQADPNCAAVSLAWVETLLAKGDREGVARVCNGALALAKLDPVDRAQLEYLNATAKDNLPARLEAIQRLAALLPSEAELLRIAGTLQLASRQVQAAAHSWESMVQSDPGDTTAWNELGYARAYNHDLAGARQALEQYQKMLGPGESNGMDSLGEVSFYLGDFAAAERHFLDAHKTGASPAELLKAAQSRMMTGDLAGADAIFGRYGNWSIVERAEWEFLTGRRKQAIARLGAVAGDPRVTLQMEIWKSQTGLAPPPSGGAEPLSRAVVHLLAGRFAEAAPSLEQVYRATMPTSDGLVRTLLAWSYARTGRPQEAARLLDLYPIPLSGGGNPILSSLVFPRFVQLRGEVLHSQKDQQLAAKYAGDLPDR
jgi:Flp pilus assembly protein TadD